MFNGKTQIVLDEITAHLSKVQDTLVELADFLEVSAEELQDLIARNEIGFRLRQKARGVKKQGRPVSVLPPPYEPDYVPSSIYD